MEPKKILVVEDDESLRLLYVQILTDARFNVDSAVDGEEAFNKMRAGGYDLVLLDIMLPKVDGLTILEKFKTETKPEIPNKHIVILSNLGQDEAIAKAMASGAEGYLIKSDYTPGQVIDRVNSFLGLSH
jgi:DNA-binding response OmpR family regulator